MQIIHYFKSDRQEYWRSQIGRSDWGPGDLLHSLLCNGTFFDFTGEGSEILLLVEGDTLISYCTYARQDDIHPIDLSPWFGFVYTFPQFRGHRYVGLLFEEADRLAREEHADTIYISTTHTGLYEKYGCTFLRDAQDWEGEWVKIYPRKVEKR